MNASLDLEQAAWTKRKHGITAIGTWLRIDETTWRPCMVLIRAGSELEDWTVPYVITVDHAWQWDTATAIPSQTIMKAAEICECLRITVDRANISHVMNFINDHLSDLLKLPPYPGPLNGGEVVADLVLRNNSTGRTIEREITDV